MCVFQAGFTPLHFASSNGHLDVVRYFIEECGADVSATKVSDPLICAPFKPHTLTRVRQGVTTPLHFASRNGHLEVMRYLVEKCGADVNAKDMVSEIG
jgi:ankyrin repeat protein